MKLNNHTVCEVNYKGKWRYVDVDFFKFGVFRLIKITNGCLVKRQKKPHLF